MTRMIRNPPVLTTVLLLLLALINRAKAEDSLHQQKQPSFNPLPPPPSPPPPPLPAKDIAVASQRSRTSSAQTTPRVGIGGDGGDDSDDDGSIAAFVRDLPRLDALRGQLPVLSMSHSTYDSTYTRSWTLRDWEQHQVRSFRRYRNNLASWIKSPTARAVIPSVAVAVAWSVVVKLIYEKFSGNLREIVFSKSSFSAGVVSAFTAPIGLMLALRTNRALNRLLEARSMFGKMVRATCSLAGMGCTYLNKADSVLLGRYLAIYGWALKGTLREEEDTAQVYQTVLPPEEAAWILSAPADTPTAIVFRLRHLFASSEIPIPTAAASAMEGYLSELETVLGVCKRLIASPIPPTFSRHTSRILCLYLGLLPVALVSTGSNNSSLISMVVTVTLLSYVFIGIDETACEIENPFPLIPMFQLSGMLQTNIQHQMEMMESLQQTRKQQQQRGNDQ
jgi:putative membrane protein